MVKDRYNILFIIVNVILYLVLIATWISIPDEIILNLTISFITLSLSICLVVLNRNYLKKFYQTIRFQKIVGRLIQAVLIFLILAILNFLVFKKPFQLDLSKLKNNELTDKTRTILKDFDKEVRVTIFARKINHQKIVALLELYRLENSNVSIDVVDVELDPIRVQKDGVSQSPTVLLEYAGKKKKVYKIRELEITNAFFFLKNEKKVQICIENGNQRKRFQSSGPTGFGYLKQLLLDENYEVNLFSLLEKSDVKKSCDALILWGMETGLLDREIENLKGYLKSGGRILLGLDVQLNGDKLEKIRDLLSMIGIEAYNHLVFDLKRYVSGSKGSIPIIASYNKDNPVFSGLSADVFLPVTTHFSWIGERKNIEIKALAYSSDKSWGEKRILDFVAGEQSYDRGEDIVGPLDLALSWEHKKWKSKMVVFGNSSFVSNSYQRFGSHFILFLNSLSWVSNDDGIISFDLPSVDNTPVFVSHQQLGIIFYFSVIFLPLTLLGVACYFYFRRRRG